MEFDYEAPQHVAPRIKCCICELLIESNPSNMCANCIRAHVDITQGMQKEYIIVYCPECCRYHQPPKYWGKAELESRELMTLCLKKIKSLSKYHLVDAAFLWTEPHSKRLKLRITLQKEIFANTVIQQTANVDYEVVWQQCPTCQRVATGQPQWDAVVQLRQKVAHRRTFLFLEQVILKHRMHEDVTRIDTHPDGLDFFYAHKSHAMSFVDFISSHAPVVRRDAVQLVSHDSKSNTAVQHHTFSLEICPLCREDLVLLPPTFYTKLGGLGPLVVVLKVFSSIVFLDPKTLQAGEITGTLYWKRPFSPLLDSRRMTDFYVIDTEPTGVVNGKYHQALVTVCLASEVGEGREWIVQTHLGGILNPGDYAKGYIVEHCNVNNGDTDSYKEDMLQDVVLVRKHFPNQARRRGLRKWKLQKMDVADQRIDEERAEFEDEVERDSELRRDVPIYRDHTQRKAPNVELPTNDGDDEPSPEIPLDELLDELQIVAEGDARPKRLREDEQ